MTDRNLSNIWMVNFDGSASRPITTGNKNDFLQDGQTLGIDLYISQMLTVQLSYIFTI